MRKIGRNMWNRLVIYPENSSSYHYHTESFSYKSGLLFQVINDWCNRGINVKIIIAKSYASPLFTEE